MPRNSLFALAVAVPALLAACGGEPSADSRPTAATAPEPAAARDQVRRLETPSGPGALAPNLSASRDGILLTWIEPVDGGHSLRLSRLAEGRWTPAREVFAGDGFFANWADLPAAAETGDGTLFAHWLGKLGDGTYAYGAALARSQDAGESWQHIGLLHDDDSPSEHGFVSYTTSADGELRAFWLDGRAMLGGGTMHLRTTLLDASGPRPSELLDDRVCECCATDAAMSSAGPVVAYRDRGETEVRDIAVIRAVGDGWSPPALIHDDGWTIFGCPVNGPAIAADGERVAVAWFTAADDRPAVKVAFSNDAGARFSTPVVIDDAAPLGRVDVVLDGEGRAVVSWLGSSETGAEVRWRRVGADGDAGPVHGVAATTTSRAAGVPRMMAHGDELLFAWVEETEPPRLGTGFVGR